MNENTNLIQIEKALNELGIDAVAVMDINIVPVLIVHHAGFELQVINPEGMEDLADEGYWSIGTMNMWTMEFNELDIAPEDATLATVTHKILAQIV